MSSTTRSETSDEGDTSDAHNESVDSIWTQLLLNWLNRCAHPHKPVTKLKMRCLLEALNTYKQDICEVAPEANLSLEDVEPLLKYNYQLLRLSHLQPTEKKLLIMTSVLLYHCCVSSIDGAVDSDICENLSKEEQEMILKYCEKLAEMTVTNNNVEKAINYACQFHQSKKSSSKHRTVSDGSGETGLDQTDEVEQSSESSDQDETTGSDDENKKRNIRFDSSVTVLPSLNMKQASSKTETPNRDRIVNFESDVPTTKSRDLVGSVKQKLSRESTPQQDTKENNKGSPNLSKLISMLSDWMKSKTGKIGLVMIVILIIICGLIIGTVLMKPWTMLPNTRSHTDYPREFRRTHAKKSLVQKKPLDPKVYLNASFQDTYLCINKLCQRAFGQKHTQMFKSLSRCTLLCMGPQLWPKPIGFTYFSDKLVALATNKLEYRFQSVPSELVQTYLAQALKLFIGDLARLERVELPTKTDDKESLDLFTRKMNIILDVEIDSDPRIRLDTDETYNLKVDIINNVVTISIVSPSFCGVRHGLETLTQLILLDQHTGYLITLSNTVIRDSPTYKYRGIMIDTARNYIPVPDIMRSIDAMSTCKLNTFHWRISDATSFPLLLPVLPQLFEFGGYDRTLVYTKEDVKAVVKRAGIRGIRVILEVAAPGPVGRAWSWTSDASCPTKSVNLTCDNALCIRLAMKNTIMDILQAIYAEIIDMTQVNDIFHLSDGLFSMVSCYYLLEERQGFLRLALERLKIANGGTLPKLPIIWYTDHLDKTLEAMPWERLGVQLMNWHPNPSDPYLSKYKLIQSSRWDLSCEIRKQRCMRYRTWQNMYSWWEWRTVNAFTIEGGESVLWTDLVDSANLDSHLWPRAAAVAERLWSDVAINDTALPSVYMRLDSHRYRIESGVTSRKFMFYTENLKINNLVQSHLRKKKACLTARLHTPRSSTYVELLHGASSGVRSSTIFYYS